MRLQREQCVGCESAAGCHGGYPDARGSRVPATVETREGGGLAGEGSLAGGDGGAVGACGWVGGVGR